MEDTSAGSRDGFQSRHCRQLDNDRVEFRYTEMRSGDWRKKGDLGQRKCISPLFKVLFGFFSLSFLAG